MTAVSRAVRCPRFVICLCIGYVLMVPTNTRADVTVALIPSISLASPGEIVDVELTITESGSAFNGYDAVVGFDPAALTFIELTQAEQEGPLMTGACPERFHIFSSSPPDGPLIVNHVLLCAGVSVTGPGVLYRLRFQAAELTGPTELTLLSGTGFFLAGAGVSPVIIENAVIQISSITDVPGTRAAQVFSLRAEPNPFNPRTALFFELSMNRAVSLVIHRLDGRRVRSLVDQELPAGPHRILWDGRDDRGRAAGSGIYRVQLIAGGQRANLPITLIR